MVIVDSPPILNLADFELLLAPCESTMLVARARKTTQETLSRALSQVDVKKLVGVVFNSAENRGDKGYYRYSASAKANG
jgi:Mrp family chromosome partitioning ATPase